MLSSRILRSFSLYRYVDDFLHGGSDLRLLDNSLDDCRTVFNFTAPVRNAKKFLGMELERDENKRTIKITMKARITELASRLPENFQKPRQVPMPSTGYAVRDQDLEHLPLSSRRPLDKKETKLYLSLVGSLIWLQGVRFDIIFPVLYLAWFTKAPLQHHMDMAYYVIGYLQSTLEVPLVLGGPDPIRIIGYTDASLGTGPKARSITGHLIKLGESAGAIAAKSSATHTVRLSSFESELDGAFTTLKTIARISNIFQELGLDRDPVSILYSDNQAMINFIKGEGIARGSRHMELRMFYTRQRIAHGDVQVVYMPGDSIPADYLTKLGNVEQHIKFRHAIQGLYLLDAAPVV